jgi:hypothetical protein
MSPQVIFQRKKNYLILNISILHLASPAISHTTITTSTTTTAESTLCPSSVWNPNGTTVAGSPAGTSGNSSSLLRVPYDVAVDLSFNLYVADSGNNRVMEWLQNSVSGILVGPQDGYGMGTDTQHMDFVTVVCLDATQSNLYIADQGNYRILKWNIVSNTTTIALGGSGTGNALNQFYFAGGLYSDRQYPLIFL